jgi:2-oxo-3-hexenedioate decarboxylase
MVVDVDHWADHLVKARATCTAVAPITDSEPELTLDDAYAIQETVLERSLADGRRVVGAKLGLTSVAKQVQMGVDQPVFGWLTDDMQLPAEAPVRLDEVIHPRVEPEIVFVLGDDLVGPRITAHDVLDATAFVCAGLEIIDSRYESFRFTLPDVVADNTSAAKLTLGIERHSVDRLDLGLVGVLLEVGPELVETAAGAACLGHPATAVAALANWLADRGRSLEAGWFVLSGGLTAAVALTETRPVCATFGHLGTVSVRAV